MLRIRHFHHFRLDFHTVQKRMLHRSLDHTFKIQCLPQVAIQRPFEARLPEGRARLMQLLHATAVRSSKDDLKMVRRTHKVQPDSYEPT